MVSWIHSGSERRRRRCWLDLGDPHRASSAITSGLDGLDPQRLRTRSIFLTYRAENSLHHRDAAAAGPMPAPPWTQQHSPGPRAASTWHTH